MKILIDTNVLISTALFPHSVTARAYEKAMNGRHEVLICNYELIEMIRVFNKKFPSRIYTLNQFLIALIHSVNIVNVPEGISQHEIRDLKDEPILRTALHYDVDILLTGDKDFTAVDMCKPAVMTPAQFIENDCL